MIHRSLIAAACVLALPALALPAAASAAPAGRFLQDAVSGDNAEIAMGRLAQRRGQSPAVVEFGRTLERDHAASRSRALETARMIGASVRPAAVKPAAVALRRRLSRLDGPRFDREFAAAMVHEHRQDIARFERQQRSGVRPTRRFVAEVLPHLQHHLELAERLPGG